MVGLLRCQMVEGHFFELEQLAEGCLHKKLSLQLDQHFFTRQDALRSSQLKSSKKGCIHQSKIAICPSLECLRCFSQ